MERIRTADVHGARQLVERLRRGVPRKTLHFESSVVEGEVGVENRQLLVLGTVLVEQQLREEGEALCVPDVPRVACTECETERNIEHAGRSQSKAMETHMHVRTPA